MKGRDFMLSKIKLNLEAVEAMLYYWQAAAEKDNIAESFFYDVAKKLYEIDPATTRFTLEQYKNWKQKQYHPYPPFLPNLFRLQHHIKFRHPHSFCLRKTFSILFIL